MRLRIGVDFHVVDGKFQGSRTHVIELFRKVIAICPDMDFYLFLDNPAALAALGPEFSAKNVHPVQMPAGNPLKRLYWQLPSLARNCNLDILHTQYMYPWPLHCKGMVTIHDVLFETHPEYFESLFVLRSKLFMRIAARSAAHVFTVSEFSKSEIARLYKLPTAQITVIHNGADLEKFSPGRDGEHLLAARGLRSKGYILSVGRLEPRKNHAQLVEAFARIKDVSPDLVLVGQRDFDFDGVFVAIKKHKMQDRVHILEDVSDIELPVLYRHAKLFVYPAFAEGFGMPPLEAMAAGVPVISSDSTAIPEVVGNAGILVKPGDIDGLATAILNVVGNPSLAAELANAGRERAMSFTWDKSAQQVRSVYLATLEKQNVA